MAASEFPGERTNAMISSISSLAKRSERVICQSAATGPQMRSAAGVKVSDVQEFPWGSFVFFEGPDGNGWALQAMTHRQ